MDSSSPIDELIRFRHAEDARDRVRMLGYIHGDVPMSPWHSEFLKFWHSPARPAGPIMPYQHYPPSPSTVLSRPGVETYASSPTMDPKGLDWPGQEGCRSQPIYNQMNMPLIPVYVPAYLGFDGISRVAGGASSTYASAPARQARQQLLPQAGQVLECEPPVEEANNPARRWATLWTPKRGIVSIPVLLDHSSPLNWVSERFLSHAGVITVPTEYRTYRDHRENQLKGSQLAKLTWIRSGQERYRLDCHVVSEACMPEEVLIGKCVLRQYGEDAFLNQQPADKAPEKPEVQAARPVTGPPSRQLPPRQESAVSRGNYRVGKIRRASAPNTKGSAQRAIGGKGLMLPK